MSRTYKLQITPVPFRLDPGAHKQVGELIVWVDESHTVLQLIEAACVDTWSLVTGLVEIDGESLDEERSIGSLQLRQGDRLIVADEWDWNVVVVEVSENTRTWLPTPTTDATCFNAALADELTAREVEDLGRQADAKLDRQFRNGAFKYRRHSEYHMIDVKAGRDFRYRELRFHEFCPTLHLLFMAIRGWAGSQVPMETIRITVETTDGRREFCGERWEEWGLIELDELNIRPEPLVEDGTVVGEAWPVRVAGGGEEICGMVVAGEVMVTTHAMLRSGERDG